MIRRSSDCRSDPSSVSVSADNTINSYRLNQKKRYILPKLLVFRILFGLLMLVLAITFVLPFLSFTDEEIPPSSESLSFRFGSEDDKVYPCVDNTARIHELQRILESVRRDLLQSARQLKKTNAEFEEVEKQLGEKKSELKTLEIEVDTLRLLQKELQDTRNVPVLLPLSPPHRDVSVDAEVPIGISFESAFDFSRCSVAGGFPFFLYDLSPNASATAMKYHKHLSQLSNLVELPALACLFIAVVNSNSELSKLQFWRNGTNHVLLNIGNIPLIGEGNAMVVSSVFGLRSFRNDFDICTHLDVQISEENDWKTLSALMPYSRQYFLSYEGFVEKIFRSHLETIVSSSKATNDAVYFNINCSSETLFVCGDPFKRELVLKNSMFVLIFEDSLFDCSGQFNLRLFEALHYGAVPVVLSLRNTLPFGNVIDWSQAILQFAPQRLPELHFILRSISAADILEMRRQGRFLLQNYILNVESVTKALFGFLRKKIGVPGGFFQVPDAKPLFNDSFVAEKTQFLLNTQNDVEYLGPREAPHKSPAFSHNFTALQMYAYHLWNRVGIGIGGSPEYVPFDPPFPSDVEFEEGIAFGFRPIAPGSGVEFSVAIGGNRPREQFTVVLLTYRRDAILAAALERLNNLPYLNKCFYANKMFFPVLVVWNDDLPPSDRVWPRLHVPVIFIKAEKNSLNNRFIPYSEIETEAVLSLDDDIDLKHYEIIFAFRVWREQRTKIVGFPARYHARYDGEVFYNSNHTCQLSMILTGAAFIHKWYMYLYTYHMPAIIRQKVDELINCEDLAMNFLVSHLTRQPPIKTTNKWTIRCPMCSEMLSQDESHFTERHDCIRLFTRIYGYNPLLFSQFRVDSILFRTRLPSNHRKCFQNV